MAMLRLLALTFALLAPATAQRDVSIEAVRLPGEGRVRGFACCGEELWLVRDKLHVLSADKRRLAKTLPAPKEVLGLTADDRFVYVLQQRAIVVMDPVAMREARRIELNYKGKIAPVAIGAHQGELFVAWHDRLIAVDKGSGKQRECAVPFVRARWLASDGEALWGAGLEVFGKLTTTSAPKQWQPKLLAPSFENRIAAFVNGKLLLVENHADELARPGGLVCEMERLSLEVTRAPHGLDFQVGPKPLRKLHAVALELQRIAQLPSAMIPGVDGKRVLMPITIYFDDDVKTSELVEVVQVVMKSGFKDVNCAKPDMVRKEFPEPPPPPPENHGK